MSHPDSSRGVVSDGDLAGFTCHNLDGEHVLYESRLPDTLIYDDEQFQAVWELHPPFHHKVVAPFQGLVEIKRWQQGWGRDYRFAGNVLKSAGPIPAIMQPLLDWARNVIDQRLNGILANFYEGPKHHITPHHDDTRDLFAGSPIVTMSFGETRRFRLTKPGFKSTDGRGFLDFPATNGCVFVTPFATNQIWKHGVPARASHRGRRISITLRAFRDTAAQD